ncbi:cellulose binding domain-containing protein [Micromonospora sp. NBC_01813]|uniref:cellulose binding domain-containing protein n=1 Tax=Micromonospora sp. NBC_01813 TaxID=2975988 RepID=UPI002DD7C714|nr:cellulose binding domain-containing protein [Micromonospora sp. NBC_01813]WSA11285.1 cellulose binding domain-containing protein [Micromonospora sp. NBC_01813]
MSRNRFFSGPLLLAALLAVTAGGTTIVGGLNSSALDTTSSTVPTGAVSATDIGIAAASAGCGRTPSLGNGTHTIQSNGQSRSFILRLPANYNNTRQYRLIFAYHWRGGTANEINSGGTSGAAWSYYGQLEQSNNSAILVAPQGLGNGWANNGGEDVTFFDNMVQRIESDLCVDTTQRFALGFSWGGGMSYALACARPTQVRAVAVISGGLISGCSGGTQPVAYFGLHGITDNVLPISMGRSLRDTFVRNNGCTQQSPREPAQGSRTHITTAYSGCRAGYPVQWAAYDNGHMPGPVDGTYAESGVNTWTKGEIWRFFSQFQGGQPNPTTPPPGPTTPPPGPTTPPPGNGGCTATVSLNSWTGGFVATIRVTAGTNGTNGWNVAMTLPGGASVTNTWNATASGNTGTVRFTNVNYNGRLTPGQVTEFGFQGNGSATGTTPTCTAS